MTTPHAAIQNQLLHNHPAINSDTSTTMRERVGGRVGEGNQHVEREAAGVSLGQGTCAAPGESENGTRNAHGRAQALEAPESGSSTHEAAAIPGDGGPVEADLEGGSASAQLRGEAPGDSQLLSLCKCGPGDQPGFMDTTMGAALGVPLTGGGVKRDRAWGRPPTCRDK